MTYAPGAPVAPRPAVRRTARLNVRLDPNTDALLREAAAAEGKSLTAFVLDAARGEARRVLAEQARFALARAGLAAHAGPPPALVPPAAPGPASAAPDSASAAPAAVTPPPPEADPVPAAPAPAVPKEVPPPPMPPRRTHVDV